MKWVCIIVLAALVGVSGSRAAAVDEVAGLRQHIKHMENAIAEINIRLALDHEHLITLVAQLGDEVRQDRDADQRKEQHARQEAKAAYEALRHDVTQLMAGHNAGAELKTQAACVKENEVQAVYARAMALTQQMEEEHRVREHNNKAFKHLQHEVQLLRTAGRDNTLQLMRFKKQMINTNTTLNKTHNEVRVSPASAPAAPVARSTALRHHRQRRVHFRIAELVRTQRRANAVQANVQLQLKEARERLDTCAKHSDWAVLASRVDGLEVESKQQKEQLANVTREVTDSDKLHSSMLELLESVESLETKVDKALPEFRREISKLDINMAQVNSQISYSREDTENLRQSVKAIAFSVSNSMDKGDADRATLRRLNLSVSALEQLSKQHSYRLYDHILKTEANRTDDEMYDPFVALPELMGEVKDLQPAHREYEELVAHLPRDCSAVLGPPARYLIAPGSAPLDTWCNRGTTLLQRRFDGSVEFNLKFSGYVHSFGSPTGEYWLGLENMHLLTADNCSSMRIDMTDIYGAGWYASYDRFYVGPAATGYQLVVGGFTGNASDAFEYQNRMEFSAIDRDRDISNAHCAGNYEGGWWFSHCQHVNINGKYTLGLTWFDSARNEWIAVATSEMTLSRRAACVAAHASSARTTAAGPTAPN